MSQATLGKVLKLAGLMLAPSHHRADELYELLSSESSLCERKLYLNLGYWEKASDYDGACQALAGLLAEAAGMGPSDQVLDVGFGFADQDLYWIQAFKPRLIVGLNITHSQVAVARRRVSEAGLDSRIKLGVGSATRMPFAGGIFDKVTALETAFHYDTREDFFREAYRVLRPAGVLATADILPLEGAAFGLSARLADCAARSFWQIPKANMYPPSIYAKKLETAGFEGVQCRSIREQVYPQFLRYARRRLDEPAIRQRLHPLIRALWRYGVQDENSYSKLDYVLVTARKPSSA